MSETFFKPPLYCQKCTKMCADSIFRVFISREARISFEYVCLVCGGDVQTFVMNFTQVVAYCLHRENMLANLVEGNETVN